MVLPLPLLIAKVFESCDLSPDFDLSPRKVLISGIPVSQSILLKRFSAILLQKESPGVLSGAFCSLLFHYSEMDGITRHVNVIDSMIDRYFGGLTGILRASAVWLEKRSLHSAVRKKRGTAWSRWCGFWGRGSGAVNKLQKQLQQQIPCGDDKQEKQLQRLKTKIRLRSGGRVTVYIPIHVVVKLRHGWGTCAVVAR